MNILKIQSIAIDETDHAIGANDKVVFIVTWSGTIITMTHQGFEMAYGVKLMNEVRGCWVSNEDPTGPSQEEMDNAAADAGPYGYIE